MGRAGRTKLAGRGQAVHEAVDDDAAMMSDERLDRLLERRGEHVALNVAEPTSVMKTALLW